MAHAAQIDHPADRPDQRPADSEPTVRAMDIAGQQTERRPRVVDPLTRKSEWSNWTVLALIILCFFMIVRFRPFDVFDAQHHSAVGQRLAGLHLQPLANEGRSVTLGDLTGRVVLLHFWQPQSTTCCEALPPVARLREQFQGQSAFRFLAVACHVESTGLLSQLRRQTRTALSQAGLDMPVYADVSETTTSAVREAVGLGVYPTTVVLDRLGRVRGVWVGASPDAEAQMQQLIASLLAEA